VTNHDEGHDEQGGVRGARRLFLTVADVSRSEGVEIDGHDPRFRELCDSPALVGMSEAEMRERVEGLIKVASEFVC
jgi:hypothetical protein